MQCFFAYPFLDLNDWNGTDLSTDFYRIRNAGDLALNDISNERMDQYSLLADAYAGLVNERELSHQLSNANGLTLHQKLAGVFDVMSLFEGCLPSEHIRIDLKTGAVESI